MNEIAKALSKQLFGAKYESARKSLLAAVILFLAVYATEIKLVIAPWILYLTSTFFTAGVMWQTLNGSRHRETLQGMFMLPFKNRSFVFSYVTVLGVYTLATKTMLIWALFFAAAAWNALEMITALLCGCMACTFASSAYLMVRKRTYGIPVLWATGIGAAIIIVVRQSMVILPAALASTAATVMYLHFADAYDFYSPIPAKKPVRRTGHTGSIFVYLLRYLIANKNYLVNTLGLCIVATFLPLLFRSFHGLNMLSLGFAVLCLNTPICTLLSCDPDLEQAIRTLPGQVLRFCVRYCLFIFFINGFVSSLYLCSWQAICGGIDARHIWMAILFSLQSAILSVILEWKQPIRNWKTESDLWHHPRKYLVPLFMLIIAALVSTWPSSLWIWSPTLLIECCVLYTTARRI